MKTIAILINCFFLSFCSIAGNPPAAVQKAFEQKFPKATDIKWGKENAIEYEAEFVLGGKKMSANFSEDGTWKETETEIEVSNLPANVSSSIKKQYPGWEIIGASRIDKPDNRIFFEADIKSGAKRKEVVLKKDGSFAK